MIHVYDKIDNVEVHVKEFIQDKDGKIIGVRTNAGIFPIERFRIVEEEG